MDTLVTTLGSKYLYFAERDVDLDVAEAAGVLELEVQSVAVDFGDDEVTNVYVVRPGRRTRIEDVESRLKALDGVTRLALYESDQHAPV